jgi:hypothetical protein
MPSVLYRFVKPSRHHWRLPAWEKGDSRHLPKRPVGCFAQMGTVPFFHAWGVRPIVF